MPSTGGAPIDPAVFGYIRVSQAEGESGLATQRRTLNDHGLRDDRIFTDVASGKNMRRPSWRRSARCSTPGTRWWSRGLMLLSLAEWERDTIRDRIKAGVDRAATEGKTGGRPPVLSSEKVEAVRSFLENGGAVSGAARTFGVSRPTVRAVRKGTYAGQ